MSIQLGRGAMVSAKRLTARQQEVYDFIVEHQRLFGVPPTLREIGKHFDIRSPNGVRCHVTALRRKGLFGDSIFVNGKLAARGLVSSNRPEQGANAPAPGDQLEIVAKGREIMLRRHWGVFPARTREAWEVVGSDGEVLDIPDEVAFHKCPFQALVNADEWYTRNRAQMRPPGN